MVKNYRGFILGAIIFTLLIPIFVLSETKDKDLLIGLLEEMEADFVEGDINMGGVVMDKFVDEEEIKKIAKEIQDELDIQGEEYVDGEFYWEDMTKEDEFIQLMGQGYDSSQNLITFTISSYENLGNSHGETSLFINYIKREKFIEFNDIIKKVENFFDQYNKTIDITTCIVGTFDEELDLEKNKKRILKANKAIKGKIIEQYEDEDILSYSIFTPYIDEHIYTGDKKMNLNIAVGYNEDENKTYIWIGTPIITIGY